MKIIARRCILTIMQELFTYLLGLVVVLKVFIFTAHHLNEYISTYTPTVYRT